MRSPAHWTALAFLAIASISASGQSPGALVDEGWFPFEPGRDDLANSLFDHRNLNESEAGVEGRVVAKGDEFYLPKSGKRIRFWGVGIGDEMLRMSKEDMDYFARRLAKMGVNLVRFHTPDMLQRNTDKCMDAVHYLSAALKKQGIYSYLNWWCTAANNKGLCFYFDEVMFKDHYLQWPKVLLGKTNPYTGIPLAKDPAVLAVELLDEDSIFWATFKPGKTLWPEAWERLERMYFSWLETKYGSIEKAKEVWGPSNWPKGDAFEQHRAAMYPAYLLTSADWAPPQRNAQRAGDQVEFMTKVERDWYSDMKSWLNKELGYEGIVIGSNWQTADPRLLDPLDQYAEMAGDATAWNCYFGGLSDCGSRVANGNFYTDRSLLKDPLQGMLMHKRVSGRPHIMTEGDWPIPNRYRAEEPFLESCYGSLQGMNGWCIFSVQTDWMKKYLRRWPVQVPVQMGQYPAASILYRNEYVKQAPIVIDDAIALKDLYALKGASFAPQFTGSVDFNSKPENATSPGNSPGFSDDPLKAQLAKATGLAYYVGKAVRTIGESPGKSYLLPDLEKYIDPKGKIVRSVTGEMTLDYGKGISLVNAPCAQGVTGFLGAAGELSLSDIKISSQNEYGTVLVVSLDGKPIKESAKILVQVMTEEQQNGYKTEPAKHEFPKGTGEVDCLKVVNIGDAPICVRKFAGSVKLSRSDAGSLKVAALDINGHKVKELPSGAGGSLKIDLLPDCLYYVISN